jgi:hypothetical protein
MKGHVNTDNEDLFPPYLFVHITRSKGSMYHFQKASSEINPQKVYKIHAEHKCRPNTIVIVDAVIQFEKVYSSNPITATW